MIRAPKDLPDNSDKGRIATGKTSANDGRRHRTPSTGPVAPTRRSANLDSPEAATTANRSLICLARLIARQAAIDFLENAKKGSK
jgi:hypothetical protein